MAVPAHELVPRESVERLAYPVDASVDPTIFSVAFAFTQRHDRPTVWHAGSWADVGEMIAADRWRATALSPLVGLVPIDLAPGDWWVWARIDDPTEDPIRRVGALRIT